MPESKKHKVGKQIAAGILSGKTECSIRKRHRADACNENYFAEVNCRNTPDGQKCEINIYPRSCKKAKGKVDCKPIESFEF